MSGPEERITADRLVANGMRVAITNALRNPSLLLSNSGDAKKKRLCVDERVPLSLHDARIYLASLGRLPAADRSAHLVALIAIIEGEVARIRNDDSLRNMLCQEFQFSSFVARVISLTVQFATLVTFGRGYQMQLIQRLGRTDHSFPSVWTSSDPYQSDTCFLGVLFDWQSLHLPAGASQSGSVPAAAASGLRTLLDAALDLGFESAPRNRCHLLFTA